MAQHHLHPPYMNGEPVRSIVDIIWEEAAVQLLHRNCHIECQQCLTGVKRAEEHSCYIHPIEDLIRRRIEIGYERGLSRPQLFERFGLLCDLHHIQQSEIVNFFERSPKPEEGLVIYNSPLWSRNVERILKERIRGEVIASRRNLVEPIPREAEDNLVIEIN